MTPCPSGAGLLSSFSFSKGVLSCAIAQATQSVPSQATTRRVHTVATCSFRFATSIEMPQAHVIKR